MKLSSFITDNITDLLVKIIEFTKTRQKLLSQNIKNIHCPGFLPKDLEVDEFSNLLNDAIDEHIRNRRLLLRDTDNVKFGAGGSFEVRPVVDDYAKELLEENRDQYLKLQIRRLLENALNQKVAAQLLRQGQGMISICE